MSALSPSIRAVEDLSLQAKLKPLKAPKEKIATEDLKGNSTFDLGLPNAVMGEVVTRFPPEPSGYLHIGHAKVLFFFFLSLSLFSLERRTPS